VLGFLKKSNKHANISITRSRAFAKHPLLDQPGAAKDRFGRLIESVKPKSALQTRSANPLAQSKSRPTSSGLPGVAGVRAARSAQIRFTQSCTSCSTRSFRKEMLCWVPAAFDRWLWVWSHGEIARRDADGNYVAGGTVCRFCVHGLGFRVRFKGALWSNVSPTQTLALTVTQTVTLLRSKHPLSLSPTQTLTLLWTSRQHEQSLSDTHTLSITHTWPPVISYGVSPCTPPPNYLPRRRSIPHPSSLFKTSPPPMPIPILIPYIFPSRILMSPSLSLILRHTLIHTHCSLSYIPTASLWSHHLVS
jgi:hypothetical protein